MTIDDLYNFCLKQKNRGKGHYKVVQEENDDLGTSWLPVSHLVQTQVDEVFLIIPE